MSYSELESAAEGGMPVELYEFRQGSTFWRYTTSPIPVTKAGQAFSSEAIQRDAVKQTDDMSKGGIKLVFNKSNLLARTFLLRPPDNVTTLTIWRGHFNDTVEDFVAYWKGRVVKASAGDFTISLDCESVFTSLKRPGLRARYERGCRHGLYDTGCTLSMASFELTAIVQGVDSTALVVGDADYYPDGYFTGGIITSSEGIHRLIVEHVGTSLRLSVPFSSLVGGTQVSIYPGCDKLKGTCINKFNNLDNFGGFPYIPSVNPFGGKSVV